jgi:AcrR family transcriptional regulator
METAMAAKRKKIDAAQPASPEDAALDAALRLAETRKWSEIALPEIAEEAGLSLADMLRAAPSKPALMAAFARRIDSAMLTAKIEADGSVKDKLFEILMRRFDALAPHKAAVKNMLADLPREPVAALCALPSFLRSMRWAAEAAGIRTASPLAPLKINALAAAHLAALRIWLDDDSADAAKTMAALDKSLGRLEALASSFPAFLKRRMEPAKS